jgi:hypothetical protein
LTTFTGALSTTAEPEPRASRVEMYKDDAKPMKVMNAIVNTTKQNVFVTLLPMSSTFILIPVNVKKRSAML